MLQLNNAHAVELSLLDAAGLARLVDGAFWAGRVGDAAMLIALDQDADYGSPNFRWFRERYGRFVYVDRVVGDGAPVVGKRVVYLERQLHAAL